ncbi:sigma-70 family RNA polymerase sigma factor [Dinghuibacter silviterrae]|uniref:RNA polymerase sigma factor n=1 Tax=Dinghuibacter silviterrae TaxID=1539049 RepID=A0A4R8DRI1_9BACT|nr:sigma-70 family RNA polymerase sigma factor [Dinghuibacter silviterrae]TDX00810.1 RNA polymerase sigma-70 factor (ECF subfamily) [Dinghuibacter silviterrae]
MEPHVLFSENDDVRQRIADGDEAAFTELFRHYYAQLRPFVQRFATTGADAEEILQETFVRVWLSRDKLPGITNLRSWIFTVASRQCLMALRTQLNDRKKITAFRQEAPVSTGEMPVDSASLAEMTLLVAEAVNRMPPQRQRIYRLSREEGLKPAAIAGELSLSVSTVKNVLVIALKEIRDHLSASGHVVSLLYILQHFF